MVAELNAYLVRYKRVHIPHVGLFELIEEQPSLDFGNKSISAPSYNLAFKEQAVAPHHQTAFLGPAPAKEWEQWGTAIATQLKSQPVEWPSLGILSEEGGRLSFKSTQIRLLNDVPAAKVMRDNAVHQILVGDRETSRTSLPDEVILSSRKPIWKWLGWSLLALMTLFIIFWLYLHQFKPGATGRMGF